MRKKRGLSNLIRVLIGLVLTLNNVFIFGGVFTAKAAAGATEILADFESGVPSGWFVYGDWGAGTVINTATPTIADTDSLALPGQVGNNDILSVTANAPTWAGFGAAISPVQDWTDYDALSFWFYGENSATTHEFEIQTVAGDDRRATVIDDFSGWRQIVLPFTTFGAGGAYDVSQVDNWVFVLDGTVGSFYIDNLELVNLIPFADFEGGVPSGWFVYGDWGAGTVIDTATPTIADTDSLALPGQVGNNDILSVTANAPTWAGFGAAISPVHDWNDMQGVSFWFYGENSGTTHEFEIQTVAGDDRRATFVDDFSGWRQIVLPFTTFGAGGAYDVSQVDNWVFVLDGTAGSFHMDDISIYGANGNTNQDIVDDFESGLPTGFDTNGIPIGFFTALSAGSTMEFMDVTTPPAPILPEVGDPNHVLQVDVNSTAWAVVIHGFENEAVDTWIPQDWSAYEGFAFWFHGNNSGTDLFIDLLENRNPGSVVDDAERWTVTFTDDFDGWQFIQFPFTDFVRKNVGNGAPDDGLTLDEVHGWAFGTLGTDGSQTFFLDQISLYGVAPERPLQVTYSASKYEVGEGVTVDVAVKLTRPLKEDDPDQVSVDYSIEPGLAVPGRDYTPVSGTLTFEKGGLSELTFPIKTFDNPKHDGDKTAVLRLSNPVDIDPGYVTQAVLIILDDDPLNPNLIDDFERGAYLWDGHNVTLSTLEIAAGDPLAVPDQGSFEHILEANTAVLVDIVVSGSICNSGNGIIPVAILTTDSFDALSIDHNTVLLGDAAETHRDKKTNEAKRHEEDFDNDGALDLIFHFRANETGYDCETTKLTLTGQTSDGSSIVADGEAEFGRDFPIGQDWTRGEALSFWFYGTNSGDAITLQLKDNRAPDPGPAGWSMVWSDEFNDPAGTPPNPANWSHEIGDGTINENPGWGNSELQYYTSSTDNSATDGQGNLVITAKETEDSLVCYYGPCEYTSARLISQYKAEFAYGRIESRIRVPSGGDGLWPAFWSLGADIAEVDWPQTGEIDFLEYVSREPYEIFGTIHGPGYSGGQSFGGTYTFAEPVYDSYHTFAIDWQPDLIEWYVDDILYHTAVPDDIAPNEWAFNDPVFLIFNMAIGGNFGGPVGKDTIFPQELTIDYVRVFQGPDTAERWEATFADNFEGWQQVEIPFASLTRSADQPVNAPDDGLNLNEVWGYGFELPEGGTSNGLMLLDQVRLELLPPPTEITVTNLNDSGSGSLRQALADIAIGGTITFDPSLTGGTIQLTSGPLVPIHSVTIDAADAPSLSLNGGGTDRVLIVDFGLNVNATNLTVTNGYGYQLAGGILNNGSLTLDHVNVTGNTMTTDAGDFWQGGGGIYNGDGASLNLVDSTVSDNLSGWTAGGIYSFFNTTTNIIRSTVSDNVALDVAGGLRTLGNVTIENSTVSGNTSTAWHGGAMFSTDGVVTIVNSTIVGNNAPPGTTGGLMVATYGTPVELTLHNSIIADNGSYSCQIEGNPATAVLTSLGNNVFTDGSCNPISSDQTVAATGVDVLADNGGPTLTHALLAGSPAIDAADVAVCPATDQRGVSRDTACDVGAYEYVP